MACYFQFFIHYYTLSELVNEERGLIYKAILLVAHAEFYVYLTDLCHELAHQTNKESKFVAWLLLTQVFYTHFSIDHNEGHHLLSNTPADSYYVETGTTYLEVAFSSLWKEYMSAWRIAFKTSNNSYGWENRMVRNHIFYFLMLSLYVYVYSYKVIPAIIVISAFSYIYNSILNYTSHYGLIRKEISPGVYEPQSVMHSWNSEGSFLSLLIFKHIRHSDHHVNVINPYQCFTLDEKAPRIPASFGITISSLIFYGKEYVKLMGPVADMYNKGTDIDHYRFEDMNDTGVCTAVTYLILYTIATITYSYLDSAKLLF
jgi:alkane 1-monooxygenase